MLPHLSKCAQTGYLLRQLGFLTGYRFLHNFRSHSLHPLRTLRTMGRQFPTDPLRFCPTCGQFIIQFLQGTSRQVHFLGLQTCQLLKVFAGNLRMRGQKDFHPNLLLLRQLLRGLHGMADRKYRCMQGIPLCRKFLWTRPVGYRLPLNLFPSRTHRPNRLPHLLYLIPLGDQRLYPV